MKAKKQTKKPVRSKAGVVITDEAAKALREHCIFVPQLRIENIVDEGHPLPEVDDRYKLKLEKFLCVYAETGSKTYACKEASLSYSWLKRLGDNNENFKVLLDRAYEMSGDMLKREARRRAVDGHDEPVYYMGQVVGYTKKFSDRLLEVLLKARYPEEFRERVENRIDATDGFIERLQRANARVKELRDEEL